MSCIYGECSFFSVTLGTLLRQRHIRFGLGRLDEAVASYTPKDSLGTIAPGPSCRGWRYSVVKPHHSEVQNCKSLQHQVSHSPYRSGRRLA